MNTLVQNIDFYFNNTNKETSRLLSEQIEDFIDSKFYLFKSEKKDLMFSEEDIEKVDAVYQDILHYIYKQDKTQIIKMIDSLEEICGILIKDETTLNIFINSFEANKLRYQL